MSALSHALGETALLDGSAEQAASQFARALVLLQGLDVPFDRSETERRAAAALAGIGRREEAVEHLVVAYRTARRLGARPWWNGSPPASPPWASGPTAASAGERSPRRPTAA